MLKFPQREFKQCNEKKKKHSLREIFSSPQTLRSKDLGGHYYIPYFNPLVSMSGNVRSWDVEVYPMQKYILYMIRTRV